MFFGVYIHPSTKIGMNLRLGYGGSGTIIHKNCIIGNNCTLGTGVVLGGRSGIKMVPVLHDNVYIGAGAKVLGPVTIGKNCKIGANAVVLQDLPDNATAVGVPAKVI